MNCIELKYIEGVEYFKGLNGCARSVIFFSVDFYLAGHLLDRTFRISVRNQIDIFVAAGLMLDQRNNATFKAPYFPQLKRDVSVVIWLRQFLIS